MKYPAHLSKLIDMLRHLPGVGTRSAERYAFEIIDWPEQQLNEFATILTTIKDKLTHCTECGCLTDDTRCPFCNNPKRNPESLCILASAREVFSIEQTAEYQGLYHVLGGLLSPIAGQGPEILDLPRLRKRITSLGCQEVVIGLDSTLEGDTTALHLKQELHDLEISITRLGFGLPMGSSLEYIDGGTITLALASRRNF